MTDDRQWRVRVIDDLAEAEIHCMDMRDETIACDYALGINRQGIGLRAIVESRVATFSEWQNYA